MNEKKIKTPENISQDEILRRYYKTCYYIGYLMGLKARYDNRNKKTFWYFYFKLMFDTFS